MADYTKVFAHIKIDTLDFSNIVFIANISKLLSINRNLSLTPSLAFLASGMAVLIILCSA
jgi:hypothetical protein